jgi:bleomycin hydrolase
VSHDPRHCVGHVLSVEYVHNVLEALEPEGLRRKATNVYLNVDLPTFKRAIYKTVRRRKMPVWFGCVFSPEFLPNEARVMDHELAHLDAMFGVDFVPSKADMLRERTHLPNHAMVFIGCHKRTTPATKDSDNDIYERWKVENSHGPKVNDGGFLTMSDAFMEQFVTEAFVHRSALPAAMLKPLLDGHIDTFVPFWDPLGGVVYT